ncbi:hypothetical protein [Streptomyces xanthochromogenes]|uniref:hypothetical protein n=1 Tax=Streptomyces xanthochromogenes TaxID=67384 RepID=UPI003443045B
MRTAREAAGGLVLVVLCLFGLGGCAEPGGPPVPARGIPVARVSAPTQGCRLNRGGWVELPCVPERAANHRHTRGSCARGRPGPHRCRRH